MINVNPKRTINVNPKGIINKNPKGTINIKPKRMINVKPKGTINVDSKGRLTAPFGDQVWGRMIISGESLSFRSGVEPDPWSRLR